MIMNPSIISKFRATVWLIPILLFCSAPITAGVIDRVVAEVNDDIITLSELNEEGSVYLRSITEQVPASEREQAIEKALDDILDGLIDKTLIAQEAAKNNISVSEEEIDGAIGRIVAKNNLTMQDLKRDLATNGLDVKTYRKNVKSQILQSKLINRAVSSKIVITEDMILDYYDAEYTSHVGEGGYYLLQIGIGWGDTADSQKSKAAMYEDKMTAKKQVTRIHKLAEGGQDFRVLAKKFSDLPSAVDGGDIGVFTEDEMASYMKDAVTSLKPGEISPVVETPVGFQFFKLLSNKEGGIIMQAPYESVKEEIRETLFQEAMENEFKAWIKELKGNSYIKKLL